MTPRWLQLEYIGKGIALALLALIALEAPDWGAMGIVFAAGQLAGGQPPPAGTDWFGTATFLGFAGVGLALALAYAARQKLKQGYRVKGRPFTFLLFLLLENPVPIYLGLLGGMYTGAQTVSQMSDWIWWHLPVGVGAGFVVGVGFWFLRHVDNRWWLRRAAVLALAVAGGAAILLSLEYTGLLTGEARNVLGIHVLLAIPLLYLLTLTGKAEETELEIGAISLALGVALGLLLPDTRLVAIVVPIVVYLFYTYYILPGLRVFKHVLRGISYTNLGRYREALLAYRRALQLDPRHKLAREGRWRVHSLMDIDQVIHDPATMSLIDLDLCVERAGELLLQARQTTERLQEAHKLLDLVLDQRPEWQPVIYYWRAVAHTHAREFDKAERELRTVLEGTNYPPNDPHRESVLLPCWQLALAQHSEMTRRVGQPLLQEGRRLEAIAAVERHLAKTPDDAAVWELKRSLYGGLTEAEVRTRPVEALDWDHCYQTGLGLLGDTASWQRGTEYLRIAAQGVPMRGPSIYYQIAQACDKAGDAEGAWHNYEMVKQTARATGVKNLADEDRQAYVATVKALGTAAYNRGDVDAALENLTMYAEAGQCGSDTLRLLTELYERKGDALGALHINEKALQIDGSNKILLERKEKYYYSVTPDELARRFDSVSKTFDVGYCLRKAKSLLDHDMKRPDHELLDWGLHLAELARIADPNNIAMLVLTARARMRRGEQSEAQTLLEEARAAKPEKFASSEEEDAWYTACRILGDLYLNQLGKPDLAVKCFDDYRKSSKSGADTYYKMGQAYEQLGDRARAAKCYQNVTVFSDHPLSWDANQALRRLAEAT